MKRLLDTHVLLWWLFEPEKLSKTARRLLDNPDNEGLWSAASTWEMAIKAGTGKLHLPSDLSAFVARAMVEQGFTPLAVEHSHAAYVKNLPQHHKDPFDRLLVAQAILEGVPVISADPLLAPYPVTVVW